jgi:hypothetical protein
MRWRVDIDGIGSTYFENDEAEAKKFFKKMKNKYKNTGTLMQMLKLLPTGKWVGVLQN